MARALGVFSFLLLLNSRKAACQLSLKYARDTVEKKISLKPLPQNFYNLQAGFFCKKELRLQKIISLPVFLRLGSKQYVDYLEKKPNAVKKD